ncbi:hypothetical protein [Croceicoccus bisphenolivorans]|uniref:hypothetical protein n=1 Tax=Croceicoccus bisphenolivorans TaxID=1783232 RepID=UPI0012E91A6B|nr:hypothetical protein [Croceicoccus bisphenolivorans]
MFDQFVRIVTGYVVPRAPVAADRIFEPGNRQFTPQVMGKDGKATPRVMRTVARRTELVKRLDLPRVLQHFHKQNGTAPWHHADLFAHQRNHLCAHRAGSCGINDCRDVVGNLKIDRSQFAEIQDQRPIPQPSGQIEQSRRFHLHK